MLECLLLENKENQENSYVIYLFRAHRLQLFSPCAEILLPGPRRAVQRESRRTWSAARLKCEVLLSGEKTSE